MAAVRPKKLFWPPLMLSQPLLLSTTKTTGVPSIVAVASSCIVWRKSPSPAIPSTCRSGLASLAPMAAGSVKPIVEKPPLVMCVRGWRVTQFCLTIACGSPAPVVTMASGPQAAWISWMARAWVIGT